MYVTIKGMYWNDFQAVAQSVQKWLPMNAKSTNPVVLYCWIFQLVLSRHLNPESVGSNSGEVMDLRSRGKQAGNQLKLPPSTFFYRLPAEGIVQISLE